MYNLKECPDKWNKKLGTPKIGLELLKIWILVVATIASSLLVRNFKLLHLLVTVAFLETQLLFELISAI